MSNILSRYVLALMVFPAMAQAQGSGATNFGEICAACHQPQGEGVPGAFPALAGNSFVQGPAEQPIGVVLNGRGEMPSFRNDLSDAQIADILTFVRSSWGNKAPAVTKEAVAKAR